MKTTVTADNKEQILQYIQKRILEDKADNVVVEDLCVSYKGSTSNGRGSLFGGVNSGVFILIHRNNGWILCYQTNMRRLFIGAAILSVIMVAFAQVNNGFGWVGIAALVCLCSTNWIINLIRHESLATNIAAGVDELICGKEWLVENDEDKERLKSWF